MASVVNENQPEMVSWKEGFSGASRHNGLFEQALLVLLQMLKGVCCTPPTLIICYIAYKAVN